MRKIPSHGSLRMTRVAYLLGLCVGLFIYVAYIKWHQASAPQVLSSIPGAAHIPVGSAAHAHEVFYGIMFDAGSTGTRVHVFQFARPPGETPTLTHETFKALKPGLSAYADDVEKVKEVFKASPFLVGEDCVSIMNGTDEGVSAWITINFLTGSLRAPGRSSVGMLDLGGGSTQITFLPRAKGTLEASPPGHLTSLQMFNRTYRLYSHSQRWEGTGQPLSISRVQRRVGARRDNVQDFRAKGRLHEPCASRVSEVLQSKVHRAEEAGHVDFYAFSYYYDLAASVGLIDAEKGGSVSVEDFEIAAKYVCRTLGAQPHHSPFLCMDLTYVSLLLREFGFPGDKVLKLTRKIDNVETSWALGAIFHYIDALNRQKSAA